ncbi:MAG: hypothetical protein WCF67_22075 [Chitinophagaceae bacterium]
MKQIFCLLIAVILFQYLSAKTSEPEIDLKIYTAPINADPCMNEYNALSAINEMGFSYAVSSCYQVYQFPYNTQCHSQAIQTWSFYQDQLFEQLVTCQNGNPAKPKRKN